MAYTPITKEKLVQAITDKFKIPDPATVTYDAEPIVTFITDNIRSNTKDRLDAVEEAFNTLLTGLTTMATAFTASGAVPVTGAVLGTALGTLVTTASANLAQRNTAKLAQDALENPLSPQTPYFDGVK